MFICARRLGPVFPANSLDASNPKVEAATVGQRRRRTKQSAPAAEQGEAAASTDRSSPCSAAEQGAYVDPPAPAPPAAVEVAVWELKAQLAEQQEQCSLVAAECIKLQKQVATHEAAAGELIEQLAAEKRQRAGAFAALAAEADKSASISRQLAAANQACVDARAKLFVQSGAAETIAALRSQLSVALEARSSAQGRTDEMRLDLEEATEARTSAEEAVAQLDEQIRSLQRKVSGGGGGVDGSAADGPASAALRLSSAELSAKDAESRMESRRERQRLATENAALTQQLKAERARRHLLEERERGNSALQSAQEAARALEMDNAALRKELAAEKRARGYVGATSGGGGGPATAPRPKTAPSQPTRTRPTTAAATNAVVFTRVAAAEATNPAPHGKHARRADQRAGHYL